MSTKYSLNVTNNSTQFRDLCVFQKPVDLGVPDAVTLAWLAAPAHPGTTVTFEWTLDYNFVWSQTGTLKPGVTFHAQQTVPADPYDTRTNQILFDYQEGAFKFDEGAALGTPRRGSLYVRELDSIPIGKAGVGIGMSNSGVFAVEAQPNMNLVFSPHPSYWVTSGRYEQGQVIDIEQISDDAEVTFDGTTSMKAVLNSDNTWDVHHH